MTEDTVMRALRRLLPVLFTALPSVALAQGVAQPSMASPARATTSDFTKGWADFGARGTSVTGDDARYERYRDLGNGVFLETLRTQFFKNNWFANVDANHVGRDDARYEGRITRPGTLKGWFTWDQVPMLMSRTTQTLYQTVSPGVFRIDNSIRAALQAATPAQQPALMTGFVTNNAIGFDTASHRHLADGGFQYLINPDTTVNLDVQHTTRAGVLPYGGTFGFSNSIELPAPISQHLTDVTASAERSQGPVLLRVGYTGSWFHNDITSITWDNPYRLTDSATAPSQGRESVPPSDSSQTVNGSVSLKIPGKSRATAYVAFGLLRDDNALILPQTINTALPSIPLQRMTVDGDAHTAATNLSFTSHPLRAFNIDVRYRYFNVDNLTPIYTNTSRVAYDTSVQVLSPPSVTERFGGSRQSLDANMGVTVSSHSTIGAGYSLQQADYRSRIFASSTENTARVTFDTFSAQWFSLHSKYEHATRRGSGLNTSDIAADGEQPGMRTFDIADRNRDLFTLTGSITPISSLGINVSAGDGRDQYPNSQFGLFNAKHMVYTIGADAVLSNQVTLGASYDLEDFRTLQWSRQANPGVQFSDPSRDWSTDGHDRVHSVLATLDIARVFDKLDVKVSFDFNRGNTLYLYGGAGALIVADRTLPEGSTVVPSTLPVPKQLPPVMSELTRGTLDAMWALTAKVSLGVTYWYERYRVEDFALDAEAIPRINLPNALLIGYQYLPYTAHTFWGRVIVRW
jgi:MtrB/PioB family decaheme-associated outer membrane protein